MQLSPLTQQLPQPQRVSPGPQAATQRPETQDSPQPHAGVQGLGAQVPASQNSPAPQRPSHNPPHPSGVPQVALGAQLGTQRQA